MEVTGESNGIEKIGSKYIILEKLGSGGQANVFLEQKKEMLKNTPQKFLKKKTIQSTTKFIFYRN